MRRSFLHDVKRAYLKISLGHIVVIILGIALLWGYQGVRTQNYHKRLASLPMVLLSNSLDDRAPSEHDQSQWLEHTSRQLGVGLSIADPEALGLDWIHQLLLRYEGNTVKQFSNGWSLYRSINDGHHVLIMHSVVPDTRLPFRFMELLKSWIEEAPAAAREARIQRLRSASLIPLSIGTGIPDNLGSSQAARLEQGGTVFSVSADGYSLNLYILLDDHRWIMVGPIELQAPLPAWIIFLLPILLGMASILVACYIFYRDDRSLRSLESSATQIAAGNFDIKATVPSGSRFQPLSDEINAMASQVQASLSSQQELIRAISHEFRTPVARVRFALQMISDISGSDTISRQLKEVDNDIETLDYLIDEILTYARVDSGVGSQMLGAMDWMDAGAAIDDVVERLLPLFPDLTIRTSGDENLWIRADSRLIDRAFYNLIINAAHYAHRYVEIEMKRWGNVAVINVMDDGAGIPVAERHRIFQPFARLEVSRARLQVGKDKRPSGFGLGLAIVARITRWHGGRISVTRSPKLGGARFSLLLPIPQDDQV